MIRFLRMRWSRGVRRWPCLPEMLYSGSLRISWYEAQRKDPSLAGNIRRLEAPLKISGDGVLGREVTVRTGQVVSVPVVPNAVAGANGVTWRKSCYLASRTSYELWPSPPSPSSQASIAAPHSRRHINLLNGAASLVDPPQAQIRSHLALTTCLCACQLRSEPPPTGIGVG